MIGSFKKVFVDMPVSDREIALFETIPGTNVLVAANLPLFTIVGVTEGFLQQSGKSREGLIGRNFFEVFSASDTVAAPLRASFNEVITTKKKHQLSAQPNALLQETKSNAQRFWSICNTPLPDAAGNVICIICTVVDVTDQVTIQKQEERLRFLEHVDNLFMHAPVGIAVFRGADFVTEMANNAYLPLVGKTREQFVGLPLFEALPETRDVLEPLAQRLVQTGQTFPATEFKIDISRNGRLETCYFNSVWEPIRDSAGKIDGFMVIAHDVTEQVTARRKVEESEQRVRSLVESAPFPIGVYVGKEMRIELANPSIIDVYGKGPDVIGKSYKEILPELDNQEIFRQLDEVLTTGVAFHAKNQQVDIMHQETLQTFYFNYSFTPLLDASGNVYGIMNTAADVTDLVTAKKATEISEEKARLAIASADLGTYELDLATNEMITSERFQEIWMVHNTKARLDFAAVIHPDDLPARHKATQEAYKTTYLDYEARLLGAQGKTKWVKVRGRVLYDAESNPKRILGVVQDITEQKLFAEELAKQVSERTEALQQSQAVLLQSYAYLQNTINQFETALAVLVPVFDGDAIVDFRFKMTNEAYTAYSQLTPAEIQGKIVSLVFPDYKHTEAFARYVETFQTGRHNNWELQYNVDGLDCYFQVFASKTGDEVVVQLTDFTKLKNLQLELERKIVELERSNKNLEEFAYAASHDLKEPIRKIHFFCDRLKSSLQATLSADQKNYFERTEVAAKRMSSLIDDLLSYSQVNLRPDYIEAVDMNQIINLVLSDLDLEIEQKQALVQVEALCTVQGHHRQLQQAFQNLIANALKYRKPGQPPVITIRCQKQPGAAIPSLVSAAERDQTFCFIEVADNGIGFEQHDAERMFHVFTRLHGDVASRGTGVGLSIVRKVIENHQGYIVAEGRPGIGAVFKIYLPS